MTIPIILPDGSLGEAETRGSGMPAAELIAKLQATIRRLRKEKWIVSFIHIAWTDENRCKTGEQVRAEYDAATERLCRGEEAC